MKFVLLPIVIVFIILFLPILLLAWLVGVSWTITTNTGWGHNGQPLKRVRKYRWFFKVADYNRTGV